MTTTRWGDERKFVIQKSRLLPRWLIWSPDHRWFDEPTVRPTFDEARAFVADRIAGRA